MNVAARVKPSLGGALLLAAIASVPWVEQQRAPAAAPNVEADLWSPAVESRIPVPHRILVVPDHQAWGPHYVIVPPHIRDAEPAPVGMVIGLGAPSVDPGILVWDGSPLANVLSVILAPWRTLAGLRGT